MNNQHHSSRGVLMAAIALLVIAQGARTRARAGMEVEVVVAGRATPSASSGDYFLFLPVIGSRYPDPVMSACTSEHPELCQVTGEMQWV